LGRIGTYALINAKVRAMRSLLLDERAYRTLLAAGSYRDLLVQLAGLGYGEMVDRVGYHHPAGLERALIREEIDRIRHIEKFSSGHLKTFARLLLERYESESLKVILRVWFNEGSGLEQIDPEPVLHEFPVDALLSSKSLKDFIGLLGGAPYAGPLTGAADAFQKHQSVFPLELAIDRMGIERLTDYLRDTDRTDRRIIRQLMGIEIDLRNLSWAGRFKTYYKMSSAEVVRNLLPWGYRLNTAKIRRMVAEGQYVSVILALSPEIRNLLPENIEDRVALESLETFIYRILFREAGRAFGEFPFSIGSVLGYYYLIRIESRNIRFLVEARQLGLTEEETESVLIF